MRESDSLEIKKYSGAGNTFLIIFDREAFNKNCEHLGISSGEMMELACSTQGLSADGGFLLNRKAPARWSWDFYNSDGSPAEMCGNAARCAMAAIHERDREQNKITLETKSGDVQCEIFPDRRYCVQMTPPDWFKMGYVVEGISFDWLDTGVPHVVFQGEALLKEKSKSLRKHILFGPRGANITNYLPLGPRQISATTYERGVEDFTLACGTGAVAAALTFARRNKISSGIVSVKMPGGEIEVDVGAEKPLMAGQALKIAEGKISLEGFKEILKLKKLEREHQHDESGSGHRR